MGSKWVSAACVLIFTMSGAACSDDPVSSVTLNLAGAWAGTLVEGDGGDPLSLEWTATQNGNTVSGPATLTVEFEDSTLDIPATISGTVSGAQFTSVVFSIAAGAIEGIPDCSVTGTGSYAATASAFSGPLAMAFSPGCIGTASETATATWQLSLAK